MYTGVHIESFDKEKALAYFCRSVHKLGCPYIRRFKYHFPIVDSAIYWIYTIVRLPHISVIEGASQLVRSG